MTTAPLTALATLASADWQAKALCVGENPDVFHPEGPSGSDTERHAKRICGNCPVQPECLSWALSTREESGVWGGLNEKERAELVGSAAAPDVIVDNIVEASEIVHAHGQLLLAWHQEGAPVKRVAHRLSRRLVRRTGKRVWVGHDVVRIAYYLLGVMSETDIEKPVPAVERVLQQRDTVLRMRANGHGRRVIAKAIGESDTAVGKALRLLSEEESARSEAVSAA